MMNDQNKPNQWNNFLLLFWTAILILPVLIWASEGGPGTTHFGTADGFMFSLGIIGMFYYPFVLICAIPSYYIMGKGKFPFPLVIPIVIAMMGCLGKMYVG